MENIFSHLFSLILLSSTLLFLVMSCENAFYSPLFASTNSFLTRYSINVEKIFNQNERMWLEVLWWWLLYLWVNASSLLCCLLLVGTSLFSVVWKWNRFYSFLWKLFWWEGVVHKWHQMFKGWGVLVRCEKAQ